MALIEKLTNIADAIRNKTGSTAEMSLEVMAEAIAGIQTGSGSSGGITLLESGSFTPASDITLYTVELTHIPDLFICYAEVPQTDKSVLATDAAISVNIPQLASMMPYSTNNLTNINGVIAWYDAAIHQMLSGYTSISKNGTGAIANINARSISYKLKAKTYKWETYRLWE